MQYLENFPMDRFDVTIFQTDYFSTQNISEDRINALGRRVKFVTVKSYINKLNLLFGKGKRSEFILYLLKPLMFKILGLLHRKEISKLGFFDAIYLFDNNYESLFHRNSNCIIGSNHCWEPSNKSRISSIMNKLISYKLIWRSINAFHLFPSNSWLKTIDTRKNDFLLSNGVDSENFRPQKVRNSKIKVLYNSRLDVCKGVKAVLECARLLTENTNLEFHIIGSGPFKSTLNNANLDNLMFHGWVDSEELTSFYNQADIFLAPTQCDSFPLVVLQALSSGTPCILGEKLRGTFDDFEKLGFVKYVIQDPVQISEAIHTFLKELPTLRQNIPILRKIVTDTLS